MFVELVAGRGAARLSRDVLGFARGRRSAARSSIRAVRPDRGRLFEEVERASLPCLQRARYRALAADHNHLEPRIEVLERRAGHRCRQRRAAGGRAAPPPAATSGTLCSARKPELAVTTRYRGTRGAWPITVRRKSTVPGSSSTIEHAPTPAAGWAPPSVATLTSAIVLSSYNCIVSIRNRNLVAHSRQPIIEPCRRPRSPSNR